MALSVYITILRYVEKRHTTPINIGAGIAWRELGIGEVLKDGLLVCPSPSKGRGNYVGDERKFS
jgi:hypothetical protein